DKYIGFEGAKTYLNAWGNWHLRMSDGVTTTNIDTGVSIFNAVLGTWNAPRVKLKFIVNADGSVVTWFINNVLVGIAVANIPAVAMAMSNLYTSTSISGDVYYRAESVSITTQVPSGGTYKSDDGVAFTALQHKDDGSPDNMQITGFLGSVGISEADIRARLFDNATFELSVVNWADTTQGNLKLLRGTI